MSRDPHASAHQKVKDNDNNNTTILEVLLGTVAQDDDDNARNQWSALIETYGLVLEKRWLPGRPADSKEELDEFNKEWPTVYFHKQSLEFKEEELALSATEIQAMRDGMQHALDDAQHAAVETCDDVQTMGGSVVMCPTTARVVARASDERLLQQTDLHKNPLCTAPILAIQGVSRLERAAAVGHGMDTLAFQQGQYLCTG